MSTGERWRLGHRPALDGLRGIAVLLVVAAHAVPTWFPASGAAGVAVFFALSGFLITSLLLEEHDATGRIGLRAFYLRRAARLFPALAVFVLVMLALQVFVAKNFGRPSDVIAVALYVGNWVPALGGTLGGLDHTWSLAVEEQFYILFPLALIALAGRVSRRTLLALLVTATTASLALKFGLLATGSTADRVYRGTDTTACLLLVGCAASVAVHMRGIKQSRPVVVGASLAAVAMLGVLGPRIGSETVVPVIAAGLGTLAIVSASGPVGDAPRFLQLGWLAMVGKRSYGLYLWHFPLLMIVGEALDIGGGIPRYVTALPLLTIAWGLTLLSWRYVEQPVQQRVRSRLSDAEPVAEKNAVGLDRTAVGIDGEPDSIRL